VAAAFIRGNREPNALTIPKRNAGKALCLPGRINATPWCRKCPAQKPPESQKIGYNDEMGHAFARSDLEQDGVESGGIMTIRAERENDLFSVHGVYEAAFPTSSEAYLVDGLRRMVDPLVSLVAEERGKIIGHIFFSPVSLDGRPDLLIMGLAPMAVLPGHQHAGIGSALARAGLDQCRLLPAAAVVVLGHPEFYPRFGFVPSTRFGIRSEYDVPEEVFMALELEPGCLDGLSGTIRYHDAFNAVA